MTATTFDAFSDAQTRLDHGTPQPGDRELADAFDVQLQAAQDDYLREQDEDEFANHFPEPADGARVEWETDGGVLYGAYRQDDPEHVGGSWFVYGEVDRWSWRDLICRFDLYPDAITVLPDGDRPAGSGDVDLLVFDQLLADGCTVLPAPVDATFAWGAS